MASKTSSTAVFFMLNVLFFTLVVSACDCPVPEPKPTPKPEPKLEPTPSTTSTCSLDTLKLGVCANVLNGLLNVTVGKPPKEPCCTLIKGLADVEAAACLCTAIKGNVLGLNLNIPISLSLLLNYCGHNVPRGFQCP